jgi:Domain of unknown function (DUF4365)
MPLPREHLLDELATAYVQAVAAAAGATIAVSRRDYGVDGTLSQIEQLQAAQGTQFVPSGFPVDFQLKGTTVTSVREERIQYDLKVRNHDLIVSRPTLGTPYYLFPVCFDGFMEEEWFALKPNELILKASAFWWTETGPRTFNSSTVRIGIPLRDRLTPDALGVMLRASRERFEG